LLCIRLFFKLDIAQKGWAKSLFESVLVQPAEVELVSAISIGDKVCKFAAKLTKMPIFS
jgi:hypothetical protein